MSELFEQRNILYNLRSRTDFTKEPNSTVTNGLNLETLKTLKNFTWKIKCWTSKNCLCEVLFMAALFMYF